MKLTHIALAIAGSSLLAACGIAQVHTEQNQVEQQTRDQLSKTQSARPVSVMHQGAWLLGDETPVTQDQGPIYDQQVSYHDKADHPSTLEDVARWISNTYGMRVIIDPSVTAANANGAAPAAVRAQGVSLNANLPVPGLGGANPTWERPASNAYQALVPLRFDGRFGDFVRKVGDQFGVYSDNRSGVLTFFKTETRYFTLPDLGEYQEMTGGISTDLGTNSAGGSGSSGPSSSGSSSDGGQKAMISMKVDHWRMLEEDAKAISAGGAVHADPFLGVLTVTGTPPQCDRVEGFVKRLDATFGKRIAIDFHLYRIQRTRKDNYGMNLKLAYTSGSGHTGVTFTSAAPPTVSGSSTPMTVGATIVGGSLNGTTAAFQALSSLGNITEVVSRSGVTQNAQILALQAATLQDYVPISQTTLASNVGASSALTTATDISGFTSSFRPKIVNGMIVMAFDVTLSTLNPLTPFTSGSSSNQTTVQLRTKPIARFLQSISLKPGETLVLTGMQQDDTTSTNSGVGSPYNPLLGGGVDAEKSESLIAIAITARLL